jgi:serine/threonine-protein kinase
VTFYTAVPIEGRMAMTTELADSLSLAERLKLGPLPWEEALDITRQLLDALACLHQQSFVHCDVTPGNILFGSGGFCKLADFSQARPLDPAHNTESGVPAGNPRYTSPEQVKGERNLDQRSDLYSLGVVLYEMLCGRPPFESRSQFELMMAHVNQAPAPPSSVQAKVPQPLDAVVLKALAKDPADRYPSAAAFADAIACSSAEPAQGAFVEEAPPVTASAAAVPESLPLIVPELAGSGEPEPATTPQFEPAEVVAESADAEAEPEIVLGIEAAGDPAVVEDPAPIVEVGASIEPAVEAASESVPQSEVIAEAASGAPQAVVTDIHVAVDAAAQETAAEIAVSTVVEAGVAAADLIVPAPEAEVESGEVVVEVAPATRTTVESVIVAEEVMVPAPWRRGKLSRPSR